MIEKALEGDPACLKLCLDRILPPRKDRPVVIDLPEIGSAADLAVAMAALVRAVSDGHLSPGEGETITKVLKETRLTLEADQFERRLSALEDALLRTGK